MAMDFLNTAKKKLIDISSNLAGASGPADQTLQMLKTKLLELSKIVTELRADLGKYAGALMTGAMLTAKMGNDFSVIYRHSEARQKSIATFAEAARSVDAIAAEIWTAQFNTDVLGVLDRWTAMIEALLKKTHAAERSLVRIGRVQQRGEEPASVVQRMQSEFESAKTDLKEEVKRHLEARYTILDAVLVRIMEFQMEFATRSMEALSALDKNVQTYRKRYPKGTLPSLITTAQQAPPPPAHRASRTKSANSATDESEEDDEESDEESGDEHKVESVPEKAAPPPSKPVSTAAPEQGTKPKPTQERLPNSSPEPIRPASSPPPHDTFDFLGAFDSHVSSGPSSATTFEYLSTQPSPVPAANVLDDLFGSTSTGFDTTPVTAIVTDAFATVTSPAAAPSPSEPKSRVDRLHEQFNAEAKMKEAKEAAKDNVTFQLDNWEYGIGQKRKPIKVLLTTMHTVLPAAMNFAPIKMADLSTPAQVKKTFRKVMLVIHPDKIDPNNAELVVTAERVFNAIQVEFKAFEDSN
ncbi:J domain-containing protein [Plasmodiophora brassicae]